MKAKLVAITQPLTPWPITTPEDFIVYCARVSNPSNQLNAETAPKLIRYLIEHKHWSPFEMVSCTIELETSRAIAAQILRHRSFSFQEFSQRYSQVTQFEPVQPRRQDAKNRQNSTDDLSAETRTAFEAALENIQDQALSAYELAIEAGVAKESARFLLPLSTQTRIYMTGSLRSWIHYFEVRCGPETQFEHRELALAMRAEIFSWFPSVAEVLS